MLGSKPGGILRFTQAAGRMAAKTRIRPTQVTVLALLVSLVGGVLLWQQMFFAATFVVLFGACLDFVDGALARLTGRSSRVGGYLDSLFDRFVDFAVLFGILAGYDETKYWLVGSVALFATLVTSFARARVYQDLHPPASAWRRDILERPERYVILIPTVFAQAWLDHYDAGFEALFWALVLLAALGLVTVLQRMTTAIRLLREADGG